jgi:hypothetical protein
LSTLRQAVAGRDNFNGKIEISHFLERLDRVKSGLILEAQKGYFHGLPTIRCLQFSTISPLPIL